MIFRYADGRLHLLSSDFTDVSSVSISWVVDDLQVTKIDGEIYIWTSSVKTKSYLGASQVKIVRIDKMGYANSFEIIPAKDFQGIGGFKGFFDFYRRSDGSVVLPYYEERGTIKAMQVYGPAKRRVKTAKTLT